MKLRRYCVTVGDNWTPMRMFWTHNGALKFQAKHRGYAFVFHWDRVLGWIMHPDKQLCLHPRGTK